MKYHSGVVTVLYSFVICPPQGTLSGLDVCGIAGEGATARRLWASGGVLGTLLRHQTNLIDFWVTTGTDRGRYGLRSPSYALRSPSYALRSLGRS